MQRLDKLIEAPANHVLFSFVLSTEGQVLCSFDTCFETGRDFMQQLQKFLFTNLDAMFVDTSLRFSTRDFRVDFLKLTPSRDFEASL